MIPWTETDEPATTPPPAMWLREYPFEPGQLVAVKGLDFACEVSACYAGYASLLTVDGDLINRPLQDLAPFCVQVSEQEAEEAWIRAIARQRAAQAQEDALDGKDLAGFICGYIVAICVWSLPLVLLLWIGVEAARRW